MKKRTFLLLELFIIAVWVCSCGMDQNTCEDDRKDENWSDVIESSQCTSEQKGEAYLARAGFSAFDIAAEEDLDPISTLGLTVDNWESRKADYEAAAEAVRSSYQSGSSTEKSIFLLGAFLSFYTYVIGTLDNGLPDTSADTVAFDGTISSAEIEEFVGTGIVSSGNDGTDLTATNNLQFKYDGNYYIYDGTEYYEDTNADGIAEGSIVPIPINLTEVNQIVHMNSLANPLDQSGDSAAVLTFSTYMVNRLTDFENAMSALGIDASDDSIQAISELRAKIDNGGQCEVLNIDPALRVVEMFVSNSQEASTDDYSTSNVFSIAELETLSEDEDFSDATFDGVTLGIKVLFHQSGLDYIPYWSGASDAVKEGMNSLSQFDPAQVKKNDGNVTLSEIICAPELLSE